MATRRYILLPTKGLRAETSEFPKVSDFLTKLSKPMAIANSQPMILETYGENVSVKVLSSLHENGAKLIEIEDTQMAEFKARYPGLRLAPRFLYYPASEPQFQIGTKASSLVNTTKKMNFIVQDKSGKGIKDVRVVAFTDFAKRTGAEGKTNSQGNVNLDFPKATSKVEKVYLYPQKDFWPALRKNVAFLTTLNIELQSLTPGYVDALQHFYKTNTLSKIEFPIKVGVIDTGVGLHDDLDVKGGFNCVTKENIQPNYETKYHDISQHGTHVAGIIASKQIGIAHGIELYSYRVFPVGGEGAENFDIGKAIELAIQEGCDIINMSLGSPANSVGNNNPGDIFLMEQIQEAYNAGTICFVAAGNDNRSPISFPGNFDLSTTITAMGRKGTFPSGTIFSESVKAPYGNDSSDFIGSFSNFGQQTDFTGPGVGVISTVPGGYMAMNGTSMACPAAAGASARALATDQQGQLILKMARNSTRSNQMIKFLAQRSKDLGFTGLFQGKGIIL